MVHVTQAPAPKPGSPPPLPADRPGRKPSCVEVRANQLPGRNTARDRIVWGKDTQLRNQVQLSAYPNCIGGDLKGLQAFVQQHLKGVVGGLHVLPFYPSSADRGFAPIRYDAVADCYGDSWDDVKGAVEGLDFCADFMVNHVSAESEQFKDFLEKGDESQYADLFIRYNEFWDGEPSEEELAQIYTRKPSPPVTEVTLADGTTRQLWCTFKDDQIDIDVFSDSGKAFIRKQLCFLCGKGADLIRLDAFGYTTKRRGTNCFFVEPETWQLLDQINDIVHEHGTELLCEVHEHYIMQKRLSEHGLWVYDFALPLLMLQALYDGCGVNLKTWMQKCPRNQVTTLDTHDGIGIIDVADLMNKKEVERTMGHVIANGANKNMRHSADPNREPDVYQLNCSYYSAVGERDSWYLMARAIQFFMPGIPLVYYQGLLAGANDEALAEESGTKRDINRHKYGVDEAVEQLERPIVQLLLQLCRFRNHHPAFNGAFELLDTVDAIQSGMPYKDLSGSSSEGEGNRANGTGATNGADAKQDNQFLREIVGVPEKIIGCSKCGCHDRWDAENLMNEAHSASDVEGDGGSGSESDLDGSFRPFSAALAHSSLQDMYKCPADMSCDEKADEQTAQERAAALKKAMQRNPERDLPANVLCMEWKNGDDWAVLEANLKLKEMRILYIDPIDRDLKVWNISKCLSHALES